MNNVEQTFALKHTIRSFPRIGRLTKSIESFLSRWPGIGHLYAARLYSSVVDSEIGLADLREGSRILHVGCGALPYTALHLAEKGFSVTAIDSDQSALLAAERYVRHHSPDADVTFECLNGANCDPSDYDAVWVSLNVGPKEAVVLHLLGHMRNGAKLIYRNPRSDSRLASLYSRIIPEQFGYDGPFHAIPIDRVKEAVCIERSCACDYCVDHPGSLCSCEECLVLDDHHLETPVRVVKAPSHPVISPLGLRPGKEVTIHCRHPFGGPLVVEVEGRRIALAREFAREIYVEE
ncbi:MULTISPECIES: nicotianamine synthase family protein [Methanocalculus]|uniref:nicotianamine synthase family protein n=1 Tax=Methanocalculus TaxID=71151 RepID=UPI00209D9A27|nr:nicotianamine synthase family protein [Methanocalculus sp. AMF5]MCP1662613.1 hypothetical protein [Methanocalculus sp. AMF5]